METKPYEVVFKYRKSGIPGTFRYNRTVDAVGRKEAIDLTKCKAFCPIPNPGLLRLVSAEEALGVYLAHYFSAELLPGPEATTAYQFSARGLVDAVKHANAHLPKLKKEMNVRDLDLDDVMELPDYLLMGDLSVAK